MKRVSFKFVVTIIAFVLLVIFAVQNSSAATVKFLFWHFETFQAIIIIVSAALGAIIGFTIFMIKYYKQGKASKSDQKTLNDALDKNKKLEKEIESLKSKTEDNSPAATSTVETAFPQSESLQEGEMQSK